MFSPRIIVLSSLMLGVFSVEPTIEEKENIIWGSSTCNDDSIRPFKVHWSDQEIADLRYRLMTARSPTQSLTKTFEYGFNSDVVKNWTDYWANGYDFKGRMENLNRFPQFMTTIQGLDVHFIWIKPEAPRDCIVKPVLILHGFPSSVVEYYYMIDELNKGCVNGVAVEIVAASMPGHYYSSPPTRAGCGAIEMAIIMKKLMNRLGHDQFFVHSNDCVHVDSMIATIYPDSVLGLHTTNPITFNPLSWALWFTGALSPAITSLVTDSENEERMYSVGDKFTKLSADLSSVHVLATRPDTIGVALSDSPTGLLTFILTLASWLNRPDNVHLHDGGLFEQFERDVVIDEMTVYWFQNCIGTAGRIFAESFNWRTYNTGLYSKPTQVPTWAVNTQFNYFYQSPIQLQMKYTNLLGAEYCEGAGHYPAYEKPEFTVNSLTNFIVLATEWHATNNNTKC